MKILLLIFFSMIQMASYGQGQMKKSDSLYFAGQYKEALKEYRLLINGGTEQPPIVWYRAAFSSQQLKEWQTASEYYLKALERKPPSQLLPFLYINHAKVYAALKNKDKAIESIKHAISYGYSNPDELENSADFALVRSHQQFPALLDSSVRKAYPCKYSPQNREFDFWIGEWDVYQGNTLIGHSLIQNISGGCAILENWKALSFSQEGKSINFINPETGKWEQMWVGSNLPGGVTRYYNGVYKDNVMVFDFEYTSNNVKTIGKFSFHNEGPNLVRQVNQISVDGGKTWKTTYDYTYKRKN